MKIILSENKISTLLTTIINESSVKSKSEISQELIEKMLERCGVFMINIENNKEYIVFEDVNLTNLIGKRFCICRLIKDKKPFGPIYVRPMDTFKIKNY